MPTRTPDSHPTYDRCAWIRFAIIVALLGSMQWTSGCSSKSPTPFDLSQAKYVGQAKCVTCHQEQAKKYIGSHHDQAMQLATDKTVLGDFADASIEHHGVKSRFFRSDHKFMVNTEGPDGSLRDFEVKYVFGLEPLQQYMVEFPAEGQAAKLGEVPRVQVLRLCWDTTKKTWFYLPPPDVPEKLDPTDDLHWTGIAQRWNNMCADCHSTDYQKNFEPGKLDAQLISASTNPSNQDFGQYHSTFVEINVSCESCHGPGSVHLELSSKWFPGWNRQRGYGLANLKATAENQIQACAPCHSRRNVVHGGFKAGDNYYDFYSNQLLTEGVYYPDGQVLDEDYVHGSFIQSKMYHKGLKCSDCHDPHTARLIRSGNEVCTSCHQHPAAKYDSVAHHFHKESSEGAQCVNCHMPATTYMAVDARRDHSLRIPRPDLSTALGTPNACTGCHLDATKVSPLKRERLTLYQDWMLAAREGDSEVQTELERANQWCDEACDKWYGENRRRDAHFGIAFAAATQGKPDAKEKLIEVLRKRESESPALARATALQLMRQIDQRAAAAEAVRAIEDEHPLVRSSAVSALLGNASQTESVALLEKALSDPIRSVRTEAARNLLEFSPEIWGKNSGAAFRQALTELTEGLEFNNDRTGAHMALGLLAEQQGRFQQAIEHYETAIAVEPAVTGPRTNLAALLERSLGSQVGPAGESGSALKQEITQLRKQELPLLERDVSLLPSAASIQYRYGLALYLDGQAEKAVAPLVTAAELEPEEAAFSQAAAMLLESLQRWDEAIAWGEAALRNSNFDPQNQLLLDRIKKSAQQHKTE